MSLLRRVMLAAGLAAAGFFAFSWLVMRSDTGTKQLCALTEALVRDASRERVVIGRCDVGGFGRSVSLEGVEIGPANKPVVAAEAIRATVDPAGLASGRLHIASVEIVRPRVELDLSRGATDRTRTETQPLRAGPGGCLPDLSSLQLDKVSVTGAEFEVALPDAARVTVRGAEFSLGEVASVLDGALNIARVEYADADRTIRVERASTAGSLDLSSGEATLRRLDLSAAEGSIYLREARIRDVCHPTGVVTTRLRADLARVAKAIGEEAPEMSGEVEVTARVELQSRGWKASVTGDAKGVEIARYRPGEFRFSGQVDPKHAVLDSLDVPLGTGRVTAKAQVELAKPFRLQADAKLDNVALGEVLRRLSVKDLSTHLVASGTAHVDGPLVGPRGVRLLGSADLTVPEFGIYNRPWHERAEASRRWVGFKDGTLAADFIVGADAVSVQRAVASVGATSAEVAGRVAYKFSEGLALEVRSEQLELADLGPYGRGVLSGRGTVSGAIEGAYDGLFVRASASVQRLRAQNFDLGTVAARAEVDIEGQRLIVSELTALPGASILKGRNTVIEWGGDVATIDGVIEAHSARLQDLVGITRHRWPSMGKVADQVRGLVDGKITLSNAASEPDAEAKFKLKDVDLSGQGFTSGVLELGVSKLTTYTVKKLLLRRGAGYFKLTCTADVDADTFEATAKTRKLLVGDLDPLMALRPDLKGGVTLDVSAKGTFDDPGLTGTLTLRDWRLGGPVLPDGTIDDQPLFTARLSYGLQGRTAQVSGTLATPWPEGVKPPPHGPNEPYPKPPGSMFHVLEGTVGLHDDYPFRFDAQLSIPDAAALARPGLLKDLKASLRGWAHLEGDLKSPLSSSGQFRIAQLDIRKKEFSATNTGPMTLEIMKGDLILDGVRLEGSGFDLEVGGRREREGALDLEVGGRVWDLSFLKAFAPFLERASGNADLHVKVLGTLGSPEVVGTASISDVDLRPADPDFPMLGGASGVLEFTRNRVEIRELSGRVNDGRVDVQGEAWNDDDAWHARIEARTDPITLRVRDIPVVVSGTPSFTWNPSAENPGRLGGHVELVKLHYETDQDLVQLSSLSRRPPPAPRVHGTAKPIELNVGLSLGDVRIDNNLAQADFRGDLQLTGTTRAPGLLGAISIIDGRAFVRNSTFNVTSGVVNFTDATRIRPRFDVRADAQIRDYLVHVVATGTPQAPRLALTSEPALGAGDIVTLITLGVTQRDLDRTTGGSFASLLLEQASDSLRLNDLVQKLLPQTQILRDATLRVTSAYSELTGTFEPVATFESKVLFDEVRLKGRFSLLGSRNNRAQVEIRPTNMPISLVGLVDSENPAAKSGLDFGGDFKIGGEWQ